MADTTYKQLKNAFMALNHTHGKVSDDEKAIIKKIVEKAKVEEPGFFDKMHIREVTNWVPSGPELSSLMEIL